MRWEYKKVSDLIDVDLTAPSDGQVLFMMLVLANGNLVEMPL